MTEAQRQAALEANKNAREAREKKAKEAEADVKAFRQERERTNAEAMERQNRTKPTPTQEETDLAAVGKLTEEHEWDGSPPQGVNHEDAVAAAKSYKQPEDSAYIGAKQIEAGKGAQYKTRSATPAKP
jgi:hypothetical protein